jgi:hypothetical protein
VNARSLLKMAADRRPKIQSRERTYYTDGAIVLTRRGPAGQAHGRDCAVFYAQEPSSCAWRPTCNFSGQTLLAPHFQKGLVHIRKNGCLASTFCDAKVLSQREQYVHIRLVSI